MTSASSQQPVGERVAVVLLASGVNRVRLHPGYRPDLKALLEFAGEPSVVHVLRALKQARLVGAVCIVGPPGRLKPLVRRAGLEQGVDFINGGGSLVDSITQGLRHFAGQQSVLLTTADLPLLTPEAVDDFVARCQLRATFYDYNIFLSGVDQAAFNGVWRRAPVKFLRFAQQAVIHGNLALLNPALVDHQPVRRKLDALYNARKHPVRAALTLGLPVALTYLFGAFLLRLVTLRQVAGLISRSLKLGLVPVKLNHPCVALDVDEPHDYRFVRRMLEQRRAPGWPDERQPVKL